MEPSISSPTTPMHMSRSSSGSFGGSSIIFRDFEEGSPSVAGVHDHHVHGSFSLGESYNDTGIYNANGSYNASRSGGSGGGGGKGGGGGRIVRGLVIKASCLIGGAFLLRKLTKSTTRWDHARMVAQSLSGEKVSSISHHHGSSIWSFNCRNSFQVF